MCGGADNNRCLTEWTAWYDVRFTPVVTIEAPDIVDPTADTKTMELREDLREVIGALLEPLGTTVDSAVVLEFMVLTGAMVIAATSFALSWRRGMAPLGAGIGGALGILILFTGWRLVGTSFAWAIGLQVVVAVACQNVGYVCPPCHPKRKWSNTLWRSVLGADWAFQQSQHRPCPSTL